MNIPDSRCDPVLPALSSVNGKCIYIVFYSLPTYTHIHTDGSKLHCYLWFLCLAQEQFHMWAAAGDCTTIPAFSGWSAEPQPFTRGLGYNDHTREIIDLLYFHNTSWHVKSLTINVPAHSPGLSVTSLASTGCLKISVRCSFSDAAKACVAVTFLESRLIRGVWGSNFVAFGKSNEACEEQVKESTY